MHILKCDWLLRADGSLAAVILLRTERVPRTDLSRSKPRLVDRAHGSPRGQSISTVLQPCRCQQLARRRHSLWARQLSRWQSTVLGLRSIRCRGTRRSAGSSRYPAADCREQGTRACGRCFCSRTPESLNGPRTKHPVEKHFAKPPTTCSSWSRWASSDEPDARPPAGDRPRESCCRTRMRSGPRQ